MDLLTNPEAWIALITLTLLEVVLGIDNIVFISVLASKLEKSQQARARTTGLLMAMLMRIGLLLAIAWIVRLTAPLFSFGEHGVSGRDLILLVGGLFLLGKATHEIHENVEGDGHGPGRRAAASFTSVLVQIMVLDIVFSLDSVITAVGMADDICIMVAAVIIAVGIMLIAAGPVSDFVERRPTVKMLALSFLVLIGMSLVADGGGFHIPKGYIYFAMGFSVLVEFLNLQVRPRRADPPGTYDDRALVPRPTKGGTPVASATEADSWSGDDPMRCASSRSRDTEDAPSRRYPKGQRELWAISASGLVDDVTTSPASPFLDLARNSLCRCATICGAEH